MIIHSIYVSGFKMIGEPIRINFPETGRIGIFGPNESGKSTLLESIEYALYGLKRGRAPGETREDIVTWGKSKANITLEFTSGENRYLLEREIGAKSGHRARLYVIVNGKKELIASRVDKVEKEIERITGMDRDSFTKLVFIKQKDLDALKKLSKSSREQLVNKVMGMEVFDESVANITNDIKELKTKKNEKDIEFENVKKNKEAYEENVRKKEKLVKENKQLETELKAKKRNLDEKKALLQKYDWLGKKISYEKLLDEMEKSLEKDEKARKELEKLRKQISVQTEVLEEYKPKVEHLKELVNNYQKLESETERLKAEIEGLEIEKDKEISKSGLSPQEIKDLTPDLPSRKTRQLTYFVLSLIAALGLLAAGFVYNVLLIVIATILLLTSGLFFRNYHRLDRISGLHIKIQAILRNIEAKKSDMKNASTELLSLKEKEGYESSDELEKERERILSTVKDQTGIESIEGLEEVLKTNIKRAEELEKENLNEKINETKQKLSETTTKLRELEKSKPEGVDKIEYTEERHEQVKEDVEEARKEYDSVKGLFDENKGKIKELTDEIKRLKPDYEKFPKLKEEIETLEKAIELRTRVIREIKETSKELRNKVLPLASFIINRILPTITDGRYSDLEITEDLKFKVHSMEAGKYKEREVFSGGTQDQFLIALRLAFTESILDSRVKADYYSLLMDECISSSDDVRKQGIFEVLELMKKTFRQLFIIAHEDISNLVDHHLILTRNARGYTQIRSKSW
jgi:exonuclease SbcC